ncbi:hypothetical protein CXF78_09395 [Shewanella sp. 11B5]|jgi:hypothetical protein|nr:hypothetical protein CXF78_09395 [Shewanella sp. 11B5]RPA33701.1 hypothetical protein EGC78_07495 [Shewanella frigidimarina]HBF45765.1 hypothetical protein [Shewanella frigidimarina]|tara:strand:+ start:12097 stop:12369 length:273 start_codon:yes stop_codon:yes gene_type:complete
MWPLLALLLTVIGAMLIYLTNKNQQFIQKPLVKAWRFGTLTYWLLALLIWLKLYTMSAAVFIWLFTIIIFVICIPLLSINGYLVKPKRND